jgi:hypothetical protein
MQKTDNEFMSTESKTSPNLFVSGKMEVCEVCGNEYDKCLEINWKGEMHIFDSFECAIHAIAPKCAHCGCSVIGHGMEADGISTAALTVPAVMVFTNLKIGSLLKGARYETKRDYDPQRGDSPPE